LFKSLGVEDVSLLVLKRKGSIDTLETRPRKQRVAEEPPLFRLTHGEFAMCHGTTTSILTSELRSLDSLSFNKNWNTGRMGEEIAYLYLRKLHSKSPHLNVRWINEKEERGGPFDISLYDRDRKEVVEYIEVKATCMEVREMFPVSTNEWEFARQMGDKFTILRISGVDEEKKNEELLHVDLLTLKDPHALRKEKILDVQFNMILYPQIR